MIFAYCQFSIGQIINIPDANFKNALLVGNPVDTDGDSIGDADADVNNDGEIDVSEASLVLGLKIDTRSISNLEGLQFFVNLRFLNCDYNNISILDVSPFTDLEQLRCRANSLTSLNLLQNTSLAYLDCNFNQLSSLTLGSMPDLYWLLASGNDLMSIDVSQLPSLNRLSLISNQLNSLNITNNPLLDVLFLNNNQIAILDTSLNINLTYLAAPSNLLTELDISQNLLLETLDCSFNPIDYLDASQNPNITRLFCNNNNLEFLDFKNGNNTSIILFNASNNPNLTCIQVDDANYSQNQSTWTKDTGASYNETCPSLGLQELIFTNLKVYPNPSNGFLTITSDQIIEKLEVHSLLGQLISSRKSSTANNNLNLRNLKTGNYVLSIYGEHGQVYTQLIIKE